MESEYPENHTQAQREHQDSDREASSCEATLNTVVLINHFD